MCGWGPGYEYVERLSRLRDIVEKSEEAGSHPTEGGKRVER